VVVWYLSWQWIGFKGSINGNILLNLQRSRDFVFVNTQQLWRKNDGGVLRAKMGFMVFFKIFIFEKYPQELHSVVKNYVHIDISWIILPLPWWKIQKSHGKICSVFFIFIKIKINKIENWPLNCIRGKQFSPQGNFCFFG